jgi:hypothetical protein
MSGFKDDVVSILRNHLLVQKNAIGYIPGKADTEELKKYLEDEGVLIVSKNEKPIVQFDFVVYNRYFTDLHTFLYALATTTIGGLIILELHDVALYKERYVSLFAGITATKVKFEDRQYLVVHNGVDYGD